MASTAVTRVALQLSIPDSTSALRFSSSTALGLHFSPPKQKSRRSVQFFCHLSLNGCGGGPEPVDICETRVLAPVSTLEAAIPRLCSAISVLNRDPPSTSSGIIRLEVPVRERTEAIGWLQQQDAAMARCFFSERKQRSEWGDVVLNGDKRKKPVSLAGVGSAVYFRRLHSFSFADWRCIKRFLSKDCPLIRAYGAIRFDAGRSISSEWKDFGAFYFIIPQVEFNELEESCTLSTNIAWDDNLLYPWGKAIEKLQLTMSQICSVSPRLRKDFPTTSIISSSHTPNCTSWVASVKKAMEIINRGNSEFVKVVLARSSKIFTDTDMDPITLLACLLVESQNAYQFCIQPPDAPAFIGNTPEQLFHRKYLHVASEALAGTRARGVSRAEDLQIEQDLLISPKDDIEFTIVRESIRQKLEGICDKVNIKPSKAIRKLPRVQHLLAQLTGRLRSEDDEFDILSSLHPSPAVCGLPTGKARQFIAETEMFDRGMYAGPVGWFGGSESEFAVGIRSALVEKGTGLYIYAGAGIVEGTNPYSEWEELELKASQFTKLLQDGNIISAGRK